MGQTLTHGIYLPDEGERNCYAGLASNWQLLDNAVGTVAEHTSQIAGKAPAVHTHTKSDITDFPAYGNTAGTICEGNDSRLSDARTPVAHTHGKADITDLFNSANTWTGQNTFSDHTYIYGQWKGLYFQNPEATAGVSPSGDKRNYISFLDSNGYNLGSIVLNVTGANSTWLQMGVSAKDVNDSSQSIYCGTQYRVYGNGEKYFNPSTNGDVYLGNSGNQWKSVYAQSYYYNGTAWGLDKENTWSQINKFKTLMVYGVASNNLVAYPPSGDKGDSSTFGFNIICSDKNLGSYAASAVANVGMGQSGGTSYVALNTSTIGSTDHNSHSIQIGLQIAASDNANIGSFYPTQNGGIDLGTSTKQWKTLNGINPGALSLPKTDAVSSISTSGFSFDGSDERIPDTTNLFSNGRALVDGWLCARLTEGSGHYIFINSDDNTNKSGVMASCFSSGIVTTLMYGVNVYVPIKVGDKPAIRWAKPNGGNAVLYFVPSFGNVS